MSRWLSITYTCTAGCSTGHSPIGAGEVVVVDGWDCPFGLRRPGSGQDGENGALGWWHGDSGPAGEQRPLAADQRLTAPGIRCATHRDKQTTCYSICIVLSGELAQKAHTLRKMCKLLTLGISIFMSALPRWARAMLWVFQNSGNLCFGGVEGKFNAKCLGMNVLGCTIINSNRNCCKLKINLHWGYYWEINTKKIRQWLGVI